MGEVTSERCLKITGLPDILRNEERIRSFVNTEILEDPDSSEKIELQYKDKAVEVLVHFIDKAAAVAAYSKAQDLQAAGREVRATFVDPSAVNAAPEAGQSSQVIGDHTDAPLAAARVARLDDKKTSKPKGNTQSFGAEEVQANPVEELGVEKKSRKNSSSKPKIKPDKSTDKGVSWELFQQTQAALLDSVALLKQKDKELALLRQKAKELEALQAQQTNAGTATTVQELAAAVQELKEQVLQLSAAGESRFKACGLQTSPLLVPAPTIATPFSSPPPLLPPAAASKPFGTLSTPQASTLTAGSFGAGQYTFGAPVTTMATLPPPPPALPAHLQHVETPAGAQPGTKKRKAETE